MAVILNIEASTEVCSVALSESGEAFFKRESLEDRSHAQVLVPFVEEAIATADSRGMKIEAVAGNGTDIYTPVVLNPYDDFTSVPSSYAKVAEVTSATTRTVEGAIDATYQVYISPR